MEPFTTLAALATATQHVRLGTLVACAPFRHPAVLVKQATAVDLFSGGRMELGIGAGWYGEEFEAFGVPYGDTGQRFGLLEETLRVMEVLFAEEPANFEGERFALRDAYNHPRPVQRPRVGMQRTPAAQECSRPKRHSASEDRRERWRAE